MIKSRCQLGENFRISLIAEVYPERSLSLFFYLFVFKAFSDKQQQLNFSRLFRSYCVHLFSIAPVFCPSIAEIDLFAICANLSDASVILHNIETVRCLLVEHFHVQSISLHVKK